MRYGLIPGAVLDRSGNSQPIRFALEIGLQMGGQDLAPRALVPGRAASGA